MKNVRVLYGGSFISPGGGARVARDIAKALDAPLTMTHMVDEEFWTDVETDVQFQETFMSGLSGRFYKALPNGFRSPFVSQNLKSLEFDEDIIVTTSNASMWGFIPKHDQRHIHYCNVPPAHYYALAKQGKLSWLKQTANSVLDQHFATFVDTMMANSQYTQDRIRRHYRRESTVVTPPVETDQYYYESPSDPPYFVMIGRLVEKKRPRIVAEAFQGLDADLVFVGTGPLADACRARGADVRSDVDDDELADLLARSTGGIAFAEDEHYGITPKEVQAAGKPVIVPDEPNLHNHVTHKIDGVITPPTKQGVSNGVQTVLSTEWDHRTIQETASDCGAERFRREIREIVRSEKNDS